MKTTETTKAPVGASAKTNAKKEPRKKGVSEPISPVGASPTGPVTDGGPDDYAAKEAFQTIMRAHEHQADPAMMARVQKHVGKMKKAIRSIDDLKKRQQEVAAAGNADDTGTGV